MSSEPKPEENQKDEPYTQEHVIARAHCREND